MYKNKVFLATSVVIMSKTIYLPSKTHIQMSISNYNTLDFKYFMLSRKHIYNKKTHSTNVEYILNL